MSEKISLDSSGKIYNFVIEDKSFSKRKIINYNVYV